MHEPFFDDELVTLYHGRAADVLAGLPSSSELGHRYVGIDINVDYLELSLRTRLEQPSLIIE